MNVWSAWKIGDKSPHSKRGRRGQAIIEFAIVALVMYLLLGAILTFGQWFYSAQTMQQAADVAAREISHTPLLATAKLMDVLYSNNPGDYANTATSGGTSSVRTALFNPALLQFDMTANVPAGQSVLSVVQTWPIINQMLFPAMIAQQGDQVYGGAAGDTYLVYPGAVPCSDSSNANRTVYCVARVDARAANGAETITWVPVIEEITSAADKAAVGGPVSPFQVSSPEAGIVALRINYGYESATMSAYPQLPYPPQNPPPPGYSPYQANDSAVTVNPSNYTPQGGPPSGPGPYTGAYGLGEQYALLQTVRPYRSLISTQAIYRREVFQ